MYEIILRNDQVMLLRCGVRWWCEQYLQGYCDFLMPIRITEGCVLDFSTWHQPSRFASSLRKKYLWSTHMMRILHTVYLVLLSIPFRIPLRIREPAYPTCWPEFFAARPFLSASSSCRGTIYKVCFLHSLGQHQFGLIRSNVISTSKTLW